MAEFLISIGSMVTTFFTGVGTWITAATGENLVLLFLGISLAGGLLGLLIHFIKGV